MNLLQEFSDVVAGNFAWAEVVCVNDDESQNVGNPVPVSPCSPQAEAPGKLTYDVQEQSSVPP